MALVPGEVLGLFAERFGAGRQPSLYRAPGRVNLIGEHTDYNLGFVFPISIELACTIAIAPAEHGELRIFSRDTQAEFSVATERIVQARPTGEWSDYVVGVARELARSGVEIGAADVLVASAVPPGSGLSSSAALEVATAIALLGEAEMDPLDIAKLSQRAEIEFVGMPCGIMDQYASVFGRKGSAIQLDCRSLKHAYVPLPPDMQIMAVNSLVKHELGTSAYRERVRECGEAVQVIRQRYPAVEALRDVTPEMFAEVADAIPEIPRKRARHVISDSQRVLELGDAARSHDFEAMGKLFAASQHSMKEDYEITCEEIDFLVDTAVTIPGVYGARMTGGGFGGCTVNLLAPGAAVEFEKALRAAYQERFGITPAFYACEPSQGAGRL